MKILEKVNTEKRDVMKQYAREYQNKDYVNTELFYDEIMKLCKKYANVNNLESKLREGDCSWEIEDFSMQAVWLILYKLEQYDEKYAFSTWAWTILDTVFNKFVNKKESKLKKVQFEDKYEPYLQSEEGEKQSPESICLAESKDALVIFHELYDSLNEKYREAMTLHYANQIKVDEVAKLMDATPTQVNNWLCRGKAKMKGWCNENEIVEDLYMEMGM